MLKLNIRYTEEIKLIIMARQIYVHTSLIIKFGKSQMKLLKFKEQ